MKQERGITLVALIIYITVMIIVMGVISIIINKFYENTDSIQGDTQEIIEFNNFYTYFLKEVKKKDNKLDSIKDNYILFASGNSFSLVNNSIYYNDIEISSGVKEFIIKQGLNGNGVDETIVYITIKFEEFSKSINYKIEEIY